jgi:hypothetical protein
MTTAPSPVARLRPRRPSRRLALDPYRLDEATWTRDEILAARADTTVYRPPVHRLDDTHSAAA